MATALRVVSSAKLHALPVVRLTDEQLRCLKLCARGISLRFEEQEVVDALVARGYVKEGVARVVTMTSEGLGYLQKYAR
jgi:hypothetical protein